MIFEGPDFVRIDKELIEGFEKTTPANVGHFLTEGFCDTAIRPVYRNLRIVGTAFTVQLDRNDIAAISRAYELVMPGDVLVVNSGMDSAFACAGEMSTYKSVRLQIKGLIVDGPVTDVLEMEAIGFPCFSRSITALVGKRLGNGGAVRVPVSIGGVAVSPGDLVLADDNGIAFVKPDIAAKILPELLEMEKKEAGVREEFWKEKGKPVPDLFKLR